MYFPFVWDWTFLLIIPGIIVAIWAQSKINRAYSTYEKMPTANGLTGRETARRILASQGLEFVDVTATTGRLTDHYNPRKKYVALSQRNYESSSVAAVAVAAHECGHAMQHSKGYLPLKVRNLMAPVVSAASYLLWPILILGIFLQIANIFEIAVYIFAAIFLFQLITLPVEYNASRRAIAVLTSQGILAEEEVYGAKRMLQAAALTYVAATLVALLNVIRFMALSRRR